MSEFSENYQLRTSNVQDAVELLKRAGLNGYVFPAANGWVCFVPDTEVMFAYDPRISDACTQPLLHYVYSEDHGWSFDLFKGPRKVSSYSCSWDEDLHIDDEEYQAEEVEALVIENGKVSVPEFQKILHPEDLDAALENDAGYEFAEAIGLTNYFWLNYDLLDNEPFEGVLKVSVNP